MKVSLWMWSDEGLRRGLFIRGLWCRAEVRMRLDPLGRLQSMASVLFPEQRQTNPENGAATCLFKVDSTLGICKWYFLLDGIGATFISHATTLTVIGYTLTA